MTENAYNRYIAPACEHTHTQHAHQLVSRRTEQCCHLHHQCCQAIQRNKLPHQHGVKQHQLINHRNKKQQQQRFVAAVELTKRSDGGALQQPMELTKLSLLCTIAEYFTFTQSKPSVNTSHDYCCFLQPKTNLTNYHDKASLILALCSSRRS